MQLRCFTLPYLYCTYSPAIAHPHYSPWFTWFISYFGLHCVLCLPPFSSKAWASQDNAMLRQSDRKCLKSFLADTGENQRDFKGVSQKQADAVALCVMPRAPPPPPPPRWHTQAYPLVHIHTHTHTNSDAWSSCHNHTMACSAFRGNIKLKK